MSWASLCVLWKLYLQYDRPSAVPKDSAIAQVEQVSRLSPTEHQLRQPIGVSNKRLVRRPGTNSDIATKELILIKRINYTKKQYEVRAGKLLCKLRVSNVA